jgi:rSAM/selenodomain-associated transferase 1
MMDDHHHTDDTIQGRTMRLLGIFAKQPRPGAVKTRLARDIGPHAAAEFYECCLRDLTERFVRTADEQWIGYVVDSSTAGEWFENVGTGEYHLWPQPDGDLGSRMESFFAAALAAGATEAVLIGSDSPTLSTDLINQAFATLRNADLVLGPAADGGYYLIGMRRCPPGWLHSVRWSSKWTLADTVEAAQRANLSLAVLPIGTDVDAAVDLAALWGLLQGERRQNGSRFMTRTETWLSQWVATLTQPPESPATIRAVHPHPPAT